MRNPHPRPWHKKAVFGLGPRVPLDCEQRAVWKARLHLHRCTHRITPASETIGLALIKRLGPTGRLDPSHQTLAAATRYTVKSVQRAMTALQECGLVYWVQRLVRVGWRVAQTSNAYVLTLGEVPVVATPSTDGQIVRETNSIDKSIEYLSSPPPPTHAEVVMAVAALAQRRAEVEKRLLRRVTTRMS